MFLFLYITKSRTHIYMCLHDLGYMSKILEDRFYVFFDGAPYGDLYDFLADSNNYNKLPNYENTPLCFRVVDARLYSETQRLKLLDLLHEKGFNMNVKWHDARHNKIYPLLSYILGLNTIPPQFIQKLVHQVVGYGVDVNAGDHLQQTPLIYAIEFLEEDILRDVLGLLLANHADPEVCNVAGESALRFASVNNKHESCKILLEYGVDEIGINEKWRDPIIDSCVSLANQEKCVGENIVDVWARYSKLGLPTYFQNHPGLTLFADTVARLNFKMSHAVLKNMSDVNAMNKTNKLGTPLILLLHKRAFEPRISEEREKFRVYDDQLETLVLYALSRGADVTVRDQYGFTMLFLAVINKMPRAVHQILSMYKANINDVSLDQRVEKKLRGISPLEFILGNGCLKDVNRQIAGMLWYNGAVLNFDTFRPRRTLGLLDIEQKMLMHMLTEREKWMREYHAQAKESTDPRLSETEVLARRQVYDNDDLRGMIERFL